MGQDKLTDQFKRRKRKSLLENKPLIVTIFIVLSLLFGLLCGLNAILAVVLIAIPLLVLFVYNPTYAYYLFVASLPLYVVPLAAAAGVNASIPRLCGILMCIVWAQYVFFTKKFRLIKVDYFLVAIFMFFVYMFISASWSHLPVKAWIILRAIAQLILALIIAVTLVDTRDKFSTVVGIILVTCTIAGFRSFSLSIYAVERAVGIEGFDQNEFASMLLAPLMISLSLFNYHYIKNRVKAYFHLIVVFGCFMGALATVSRGFLVSVVGACIALVCIEPDRKKLVVLLVVVLLITAPYYMKKYTERMGKEQFELSTAAQVPRGRAGIWLIGFEVFKNYPAFGVGIGGFPKAFDDELQKDPSRIHFWEYGRVAHNDYLIIAAELGVVGFVFWTFLVTSVFRKGFRTLVILERLDEKYLAAILRGMIAGMVGLMVASIFLGLYYTKFMWLEYTLFILLGSIARLLKEKSADKELVKMPNP